MKEQPFDTARALRWLRGLKKNNDRNWFAAHRDVYDEHVRPEWEDLVTGLIFSAVRFDQRFANVDPRRCLFRLARDIRFSDDKTPFKSHVAAWLSPFGKSGAYAGFYVSVSPGDSYFSAGIYTPEKPVLEALRRRMASDPLPFERILRSKAIGPYLPLRMDPLQRMPRGFPKEHPNGELIRARNYLVRRRYTDAELSKTGAFATFRTAIRDCAPFVRYLDDIAATASNAARRNPMEGCQENSSSDNAGLWSSPRF